MTISISVLAVLVAAAAVGVVLFMTRGGSASTASSDGGSANVYQGGSPPVVTPTAKPAAIAAARREYVAAAAKVNAAYNHFGNTFDAQMSKPCTCPPGEFDAKPAVILLPGVIRQFRAMETTLVHIKTLVPAFSADLDAAIADNRRQADDLSAIYTGWQQNDAKGSDHALDTFLDDSDASLPTVTRLRADLGLGPPG